VLFLDLQTFPDQPASTEDGLYTLEDVLLSIRGRRYAPDAVLERTLKSDEEGLMTIPPPRNPAVLFDMTGEEIVTIVDLIKESHKCSIIVLDLSFDATERIVLPLLAADCAVVVSNGSWIANRKTAQLADVLPALCTEDPIELYEKICLLYNRFRRGKSEVLQSELFVKLGGIGELSVPDPEDLIAELAVAPAMERLYRRLTKQGG
jgi:MinD-like ATPase involved in chromosome partitioning or flagellar assembly